jgi:hypothetical protein
VLQKKQKINKNGTEIQKGIKEEPKRIRAKDRGYI